MGGSYTIIGGYGDNLYIIKPQNSFGPYMFYMYNINSQVYTYTGTTSAGNDIQCYTIENNIIYYISTSSMNGSNPSLYGYDCNSNANTLICDKFTQVCEAGYYYDRYLRLFRYSNKSYAICDYTNGNGNKCILVELDHNSKTSTKITNLEILSRNIYGIVKSNNLMYICCAYGYNSDFMYWTFDGSTAESYRPSIPCDIINIRIFSYNNIIYSLDTKFLSSFNPKTNTFTSLLPSKYIGLAEVVPYNNVFYCRNGINNNLSCSTILVNSSCNPYTVVINPGKGYSTGLIDNSENSGDNTRYLSEFSGASYFGASGTEESSPIYYGNGSQWIKFKN